MNELPMNKPRDTHHERFLQLFVRHERPVRAYARTLLGSWEDVDEVMQETSLVAWRKFDQFDSATNFAAWLGTIARFEALKLRRAKQRDRLVFSDHLMTLLESEGLEELGQLERQRSALQRCLDRLSTAHRRVLHLSYGLGLKYCDIATQTGYTVDALYKVLQRLRTALLKCTKHELVQEPGP